MNRSISVIVPIYNVEKYLDRCIQSIVNQTYKNLEIILVDDGSSDGSPLMCDEWKKKDIRISVIHKTNGGLSDARNKGLEVATGEYILFVDSDDFLELDACEKLMDSTKNNKVDFVVGVIREINNDQISFQKRSNIKSNVVYNNEEFIIDSINANEWYAPAVLNLYRSEFLKKNNLKFKVNLLHEDMEFLPKIYLAADKILYLDYAFYNYEIRENSITTTNNYLKKTEDFLYIFSSWKKQFDGVRNCRLQKKLYGVLIKHYLHSCRELKIERWKVSGVNAFFSFRYALNIKEKIKVVVFTIAPKIYNSI